MIELLYLGIVNGMISLVITKGEIFDGLRRYFFNRSTRRGYFFFHALLSCPYCFSHWVAIAMTAIWQVKVTHGAGFLDYLVSMFVNVTIATVTWAVAFGLQNWAEKE